MFPHLLALLPEQHNSRAPIGPNIKSKTTPTARRLESQTYLGKIALNRHTVYPAAPNMSSHPIREGGIEAPTRHPIKWRDPEFVDEEKLVAQNWDGSTTSVMVAAAALACVKPFLLFSIWSTNRQRWKLTG